MRGWILILFLGSVTAQDEVKSRKSRIDEVNDDYDGKADEQELSVADQHRLIHEQAARKAHEDALKAAGHDPSSSNSHSHTVTSSETVHSVHTEVTDNASGETLKEKLEVTKTVRDSDGNVREDHFVAEMEEEAQGIEEDDFDIEEYPKSRNEPANKEVHDSQSQEEPKTLEEPTLQDIGDHLERPVEDSPEIPPEDSPERSPEAALDDVQNDEEFQERMDSLKFPNILKEAFNTDLTDDSADPTDEALQTKLDSFSGELNSLLSNAINTQRKLKKQMAKQTDGDEVSEKSGNPDSEELEDNSKIYTAIDDFRILKEIEVDGIKFMSLQSVKPKGIDHKPIDEQQDEEKWEEKEIQEQLLLRRQAVAKLNPTTTSYNSIDHLHVAEGDYTEADCRNIWILNDKPMMEKCTSSLRTDKRPWCSLDEVFQGRLVLCNEPEDQRLIREQRLEAIELYSTGNKIISGWDSRRSVMKSGFEKIEKSFELGYERASGILAWAKLNGYFLKMNVQEARQLAQDGADRGQALDQAVLGFMYATGVGFPVNQAKAFLHWSFAAASGINSADMALGFRYSRSVGVGYNCEAAMVHYQRAASRVVSSISYSGGNAKAKWTLEQLSSATFDESGLHDLNLINYYELLANQGEDEAMVKLAEMFVDRAYERDYQRAADLFRNAAKTKPLAAAQLGRLYLDGRGVLHDTRLAYEWLKKAADKKSAMGQTYLGVMFEEGTYPVSAIAELKDKSTTGPRYTEAIKHYSLAVEQGYVVEQGYPEACYRLAMLQIDGRGTKQDLRSGVKNLQIAAQHQNVKAIYQLAQMQSTGKGIPRNCPAAVDMFKNVAERGIYARLFMHAASQYKAENFQSSYVIYANLAEMGFAHAQSNVAELLEHEEITITGEQNPYPRALASFQRAAIQGVVSARVKVGDYNFYGHGTNVDQKVAGDNYREAAEQHGNAQAFFNLGWMHHHGVGLVKDKHLAKRFYDQSIEVNPDDATLPATLAIIQLYFGGYFLELASGIGKITMSSVSDHIDVLINDYVGDNWDIYIGLFLALVLFFVINFRRQ